MTPTPAGEGKSTTTVGLADGLRRLGKRAVVALREPSLGPVFGMKGGATGGGRAQLAPMEDINLHFTGDMHAIGAAHNLLAAMLDNHLTQGNALGVDTRRVLWKRVVDMNDRALRNIVLGLGGPAHGVPREGGFEITVASEVMAILCLSADLVDFKARAGHVVVAETPGGAPVTAADLRAAGAMAVLMKVAIKPNLVQTLEGTPALEHGGPFGNIAHACNSIIATRPALKLGEIVVTEAGFPSELGAEKFIDINCRTAGLMPSVAAVRGTLRGGGRAALRCLYRAAVPLERKIETVAPQVYGADGVRLSPAAAQKLARWQAMGHGRSPVCMAKAQNSRSGVPKKMGRA